MFDQDFEWLKEIDDHLPGLISVNLDGVNWLANADGAFLVTVRSDYDPPLPDERNEQARHLAATVAFTEWMKRKDNLVGSATLASLIKWTQKCEKRADCKNCNGTGMAECCDKGQTRCECDCGDVHTRTHEACNGTGKRPCGRCTYAGVRRYCEDQSWSPVWGLLCDTVICRILPAYPFGHLEAESVKFFTHRYEESVDLEFATSLWICDAADQWRIWIKGYHKEADRRQPYPTFTDLIPQEKPCE